MTDIASLRLRIDSLEADLANRRLNDLTRQGQRAERATDGLTAAFKRWAGPAALVAGSLASLKKTISVTREFNVLNAQLVTATGSAENAALAFTAIQDFAQQTPYDLQQVTEGFTKLVNLGLTPSEEALMSYGDTASSMGKDLNQLIEAVADAATGEFERLKEFGIKAKSEGDKVSFTFRGVSTTVGKNAAEIERYLIDLGKNNFAGAMTERMNTLDGAISNLSDEWNTLWRNVSDQGVGAIIEDAVRGAIDILAELNAMLASGELQGYLSAIGSKFFGFADDVRASVIIAAGVWSDFLGTPEGQGVAGSTNKVLNFIKNSFLNLPENIRAAVKLMAVEVAAFVDTGIAYFKVFGEIIGLKLAQLVEKTKAYGKAIANALNPFADDDYNLDAELARLDSLAADMADEAIRRAEKQVEITRQARRDSIIAIIEERQASIDLTETKIRDAKKLREEYEKTRQAESAVTGDRLAQFGKGGGSKESGPSKEDQKRAQRLKEQQEREFQQLVESLRSEEEVIADSYARRLAIILANTEEGSQKQIELKKRLDEQYATEALGDLIEQPDTFEEQITALDDYYNRRRELILSNVQLTEEQRTELEERLTNERNERLDALEKARTSAIFQNSSNLFGSLAELTKTFAGEQSGAYRALFAVSKAFAIADAIIKIQQGIANAASLPFPTNLAAIGTVASATASIISTIEGTNFSGAYDNGGIIPSGKVGLVGEFGPELVEGPANVRSRRETAEMFKDGKKEAAAPVQKTEVKPTIINVLDPALVSDYLSTSEGEEAIVNIMQRNRGALSA